jgi:hypothetical protein
MRWRRTRRGHCLGRTRTPLPPGASLPSRRAPSPAPPSATCLGGNPSCGCGERDELEHRQGKGRGSRSARNSACSDLHRVGCAACARRVRRRRGVAIAGAAWAPHAGRAYPNPRAAWAVRSSSSSSARISKSGWQPCWAEPKNLFSLTWALSNLALLRCLAQFGRTQFHVCSCSWLQIYASEFSKRKLVRSCRELKGQVAPYILFS